MTRARLAGLLLAAAVVLSPLRVGAEAQAPSQAPVGVDVAGAPFSYFEPRDKDRRQFGPLLFRGAVTLTSPFKNFGGISSIRVQEGGERFLAVTDKGWWVRGKIRYSGKAPAGLSDVEMAPMLGVDGRPLARRGWYDSESLTLDGSTAYVGFERVHQIVRFDVGREGLVAGGRAINVPAELKSLPPNRGLEAIAFVPKGLPLAGTIIAISEEALDTGGNIRAFLIGGATPGEFSIKRTNDFAITDAAITPSGDLLILERKFSLLSGPGMRIRRLSLEKIAPGALVEGPALITADAGFEIDNMEGLSVHTDTDGSIVLTLVSDDNFSSLQRTLLLQFTLTE
ncbi:MAG: hypothetical protein QOD74_1846 [Variibacter sp.]|jgi:hypothetical protein|nr:hypothetical protein [Variibacter sp.]